MVGETQEYSAAETEVLVLRNDLANLRKKYERRKEEVGYLRQERDRWMFLVALAVTIILSSWLLAFMVWSAWLAAG